MFKCLIQIIQINSFGIFKSPNIPRQLASVGNDCIIITGINGSPTKGQTTLQGQRTQGQMKQGQTTLGQMTKGSKAQQRVKRHRVKMRQRGKFF